MQIYGVNYYENYTPVARLASFQLLIAMANRSGWPLDSFDFDSAYLNSVLSDDNKKRTTKGLSEEGQEEICSLTA